MIQLFPGRASLFPFLRLPVDCSCRCKCPRPDEYGMGYMDGYAFGDYYKVPPR